MRIVLDGERVEVASSEESREESDERESSSEASKQ